MKTPVVLRSFKTDWEIKVVLFPNNPAPGIENQYPEYVRTITEPIIGKYTYTFAKLDYVMENSTSIRPEDMENILREVRKDYDIQIIEGQFEVGGRIWNT